MRYTISTPICPVCHEECETIAKDINGDVCGCDRCLTFLDAYEWQEEEDDLERDYHDEMFMSDR